MSIDYHATRYIYFFIKKNIYKFILIPCPFCTGYTDENNKNRVMNYLTIFQGPTKTLSLNPGI